MAKFTILRDGEKCGTIDLNEVGTSYISDPIHKLFDEHKGSTVKIQDFDLRTTKKEILELLDRSIKSISDGTRNPKDYPEEVTISRRNAQAHLDKVYYELSNNNSEVYFHPD